MRHGGDSEDTEKQLLDPPTALVSDLMGRDHVTLDLENISNSSTQKPQLDQSL